METPSNPKTEDYTYKQGQYSSRKKKDTTPKDATTKKVEIDRGSLESAENRLKSVLADFERQGNRMKNGSYVDKKVSMYSILCAVFSLLFACLMCYLWVDAAKDRDNYKRYYEYFQEMDKQKSGE